MARTSSRDVSLTLSIETLGEEGIRKLEDSVRALAKEGGDAGPEFQQLANELARIGEQRDALQAFRAIADETDRLEQRQTEAAGAVQRLTNELTQQGAAVTAARTKQSEAVAEVQRLKAALAEATAAVKQNRTGYDAAGVAIDGYKTKTSGLIAAQAAVKLELDKAKEAQRDANKEAAAAVTAQTKLAAQMERAEKAAKGAATAISSNATALTEAAVAAEKLGVSTANVAQAEGDLLAAFNQVGSAAGRAAQETDEYAQAQDRLKFALQSQQAEADDAARAYAEQSRFIAEAEDAIRGYEQALLEAAAAEDKRVVQAAIAESAWQAEAEAIVDAAEAARKFEREVQLASAAALELRGIKAFEDQARQAQDLLKASEYVEFWTRSLNEAEAETKQFQGALDRLDVRSVEQIKNEIEQTRQAMATLATRSQQTGESFTGAFTAGEARIKALEREIREVAGALTLADKAADLFRNSIGQITAGNLLADAIGSIVERTKDMGREFFTVNIEFERLQRALTVVTGSSEAAAAKIEFLRKVANNSGQSISAITDSFIRFQASALSAGIATEKVDSIFQLIVNSGGKLGLTSDQVAGSLEALGQIASKGVLSLEELRQQLGDRFPAALSITAKGFGFAQNEIGTFVKQIESGSITADEFFNAFKKGITETFGDSTVRVEGLLASFNRLKNALTEIAQSASGSAFFNALANTLDFVAANLRTTVDAAYALGKAFVALKFAETIAGFVNTGNAARTAATNIGTSTAATVADTAATQLSTAAKAQNAAAFGAIAAGLGNLAPKQAAATASTGLLAAAYNSMAGAARTALAALGGIPGVALAVAVNARDLGTWLGESAAKFALWAQGAKDADAELARLAAEETKRAEARRAQDEERELQAARQISKSVEIRKELEKRLEVDEKGVKAAEATAEASRSLAELLGDEANTLKVVAEGATAVAEAKQKAATTSAAVVTALEQEIARIEATRDANGRLTSGMEETLKKSRELRDAKIELTTRARAEAEAAKNNAATQRIAAASYGDLSGKVKELGQAADDARLKLATMSAAGIRDSAQLAAATRAVGEATQVYRKALDDQAKSIKASSDLEQANYDLKLAGLNVRKSEIEQLAASARARGKEAEASGDLVEAMAQERKAIALEIEAKKIQIEISDLTAKAKRLEAEAQIEIIEAERVALKASGDLSEAKSKEFEARTLNARAKILEAEANGVVNKALREEIKELENKSRSLGKNKDSYDKVGRAAGDAGRAANNFGNTSSSAFGQATSAAGKTAESVRGVTREIDAAMAKLTPFAQAWQQLRNQSVASGPAAGSFGETFANTPSGGITRTVSTGQATNKPAGQWYYTTNPYEYTVPGADASGKRLPGGWAPVRGGAAPSADPGMDLVRGRAGATPIPPAATPAAQATDQLRLQVALQQQLANLAAGTAGLSTQAANQAAASQVVEIRFRRPDGSAVSVTAANRSQADDLIRLLEEEYRFSGGG